MIEMMTATERHCDVMRLGFTKMVPFEKHSNQKIKDAKERAEIILKKLEKYEV